MKYLAEKVLIKNSEARILVYISMVNNHNKGLSQISVKLNMEYGYCIRILREMIAKKWVYKHRRGIKVSYDITRKAPVKEAREVLVT